MNAPLSGTPTNLNNAQALTRRIQQCQIYGIGMLGLSHEFIKILDEEMGQTSDYMLYVICEKGNI